MQRSLSLSAGDDEIDRLWPFAFFVGLDIETDTLSFSQAFHTGLFDCGDVNEHIASAVIRLDEALR